MPTTDPTADPAAALTTGWEPDLDLGDTLVRHYCFALAAANAVPARAMGGRVLERDDVIAADLGAPNAVFNAAVLTRPPREAEWDAVLADVEGFFAAGTGDVFVWSPWPTPDLRRRGWELEGHPPLLVRPPSRSLPPAPAGLEIREVTDRRTLADFERVLVDGFPFDELQPHEPGGWLDERVLAVPDNELYVGYVDGAPVVSGWLLLHGGLGTLVMGATLPEARGRGYWRGMLRKRLERAGDRVVAASFSDMSRPGAQKHGFLPITRFTLWHRPRGA